MKVIAHRGASGEFPENSLLAFEQAIVQQADGIELDVHFHDESQTFIIIHDAYLDKTTDGKGHFNDLSLAQLTALSLSGEQKLVTLEQALIQIAGRTLLNIELKTATDDQRQIELQLSALKKLLSTACLKYGFTDDKFILSSFNHHVVYTSKKIMPHINTAALIAHCPLNNADFADAIHCDFINPDINILNKAFVDDAKEKGYQVFVYTVDRIKEIELCQKLKVDGVFTNFPAKTRAIINGGIRENNEKIDN